MTILFLLILLTAAWKRSEAWQTSLHVPSCHYCLLFRSQLLAASSHEEYIVEVSYEGISCELSVRSNESILTAMERAGVSDCLAIPELPSECQRSNCMTCTGLHTKNSCQSSLRRGEDGLSPHMSKEVAKRGYILTCSSHVVGDGLMLALGENHRVWNEIYWTCLKDDAAQLVGRAATAKTI